MLLELPEELFSEILDYLSPNTHQVLTKVCRKSRKICLSDELWLKNSLKVLPFHKEEIKAYKNKYMLYFKIIEPFGYLMGIWVVDYPFMKGGLYKTRFSITKHVLICEKIICPCSELDEFQTFSLNPNILINDYSTKPPISIPLFGIGLNGVDCLSKEKAHVCEIIKLKDYSKSEIEIGSSNSSIGRKRQTYTSPITQNRSAPELTTNSTPDFNDCIYY
jgi:hypothetical protein